MMVLGGAVYAIFRTLIVGAMLAAGAAAAAESKDPPKPPKPSGPSPEFEAMKSPMVFYLAKGPADSCGSGCSEWIVGEGTIGDGTAGKMRAFLKRQSGPKRPIYFYSPGGLLSEGLAMGRLMRDRGLTAGVARTVLDGCEPKECAETKKSGRELKAKFLNFNASCSSACVYALVGARTRAVAPEARLGIHASRLVLDKIPKGIRISPRFLAEAGKRRNEKITRYLLDMGIKTALLEAAEKISHENIKYLTRDEIVRYGVDPRLFVESAWAFDQRAGVVKFISESNKEATESHTTTLRLGCLGVEKISVAYARDHSPNESIPWSPLKVSVGGKTFDLNPRPTPVTSNDVKVARDLRQEWVPVHFFALAAADDHIVLSEGDKNARITKISTDGLTAAMASLRCYPAGTLGPRAALTPRHLP
jgi:hypothetical protein